MRPDEGAQDMQKVVGVVLIALILLPLAGGDVRAPDETREARGGHAILLEHYTATWCETCATIDPWISEFADDHESRMVRVALHPDDHDPFGSPLTTQRLALKQAEQQLSLPTFWFDGEGQLEGQVSQSLLENGLRSAEVNRQHWIGMHVWWDTWGNQPHDDVQQLSIHIEENLPENASITVFRLESLEMTSEIAYNGIDVHHDVATQMITFDQYGIVTDSFEGVHGWTISNENLYSEGGIPVFMLETWGEVDGFVTVIEVNGEVRGVIGISNDDMPRNPEIHSQMAIFFLLSALVASGFIVRRR